ncbi:MAG: DNA polymerase III subunit delta [Chitinophagales bacterium]
MSSKDMEKVIQDFNNRKIAPIYLLHGDESFYIDKISAHIEEHLLNDQEKAFNQTIAYGKDTDPVSLLDALRRYPMGAERQLVILKEAQSLKDWDPLVSYAENPMPTTVFVIVHKHKSMDKRLKIAKALKKSAVIFEPKKMYENQVPAFINERAAHYKLHFEYKASMLLSEYLGMDLSKIDNEIKKIAMSCGEGSRVSESDIERLVGISKDFNVFELTKALAEGNAPKAFQIVNYFIANPKKNHPLGVVGTLYSFFSKAYVYQHIKTLPDSEVQSALRANFFQMKDLKNFVGNYSLVETESIMEILQEYDLKFKGVGAVGSNNESLLTEMVFKMVHPEPSFRNYGATG